MGEWILIIPQMAVKGAISRLRSLMKSIIQGDVEPENLYPKVRFGNNVRHEKCLFGDFVSIGSNNYLNRVEIGNYSYLSENVCVMNTEIGKFCSIGQNVGVSLGRHPSNTFVSTSPVFFSIYKQCGATFADQNYFNEMGNCTIGNDVWIGANAVVMDDVTVGDGAIIGAGAIVTKNVAPYAIVGGVPAKLIKYRFSKEQIDFLKNFKWWDRDISWIESNYKQFHNIEEFMATYNHDNG